MLTFVRPPRNLVSFADLEELEAAVHDLGDGTARGVGAVVLTSGTPGYFVGHAALTDLLALPAGAAVGRPSAWFTALRLLESGPLPVVAAIDGQAWGGGLELALACTIRVASPSSSFAFPEVDLAIIPGAGGTVRLPRLVGPGRAADLILAGMVIDGHEANRIGLVEHLVVERSVLDRAVALAQVMATKHDGAVRAAKAAISVADHREEAVQFRTIFPSDEALRRVAALQHFYEQDDETVNITAFFA